MLPHTLQSYVRAVHFRPFRLVMTGGKTYEIRHPELIRVGMDVIIYYYASPPDAPFDRWESVSLSLIQNVEPIDVPAASGTGP